MLRWLYTLELEGGYFFVGIDRNPNARLFEHQSGRAMEWTRIHRPVKVSALQMYYPEDGSPEIVENYRVQQLMFQYGIDKVRGGSFTATKLPRDVVKYLAERLFQTNCGCRTCGRASHVESQCNATTDVEGNLLHEIRDGCEGMDDCVMTSSSSSSPLRRKLAFEDRSNSKRGKFMDVNSESELVHKNSPNSFLVDGLME